MQILECPFEDELCLFAGDTVYSLSEERRNRKVDTENVAHQKQLERQCKWQFMEKIMIRYLYHHPLRLAVLEVKDRKNSVNVDLDRSPSRNFAVAPRNPTISRGPKVDN